MLQKKLINDKYNVISHNFAVDLNLHCPTAIYDSESEEIKLVGEYATLESFSLGEI